MVGNGFVNDTFSAFLSHTTSGQNHAAPKYRHFSYLPVFSVENWQPPQILFGVCLPAPCSLFMVLSTFRKKLCCGEVWRGHWMRNFVFILQKLLPLTRNMFLCSCPSALSINMLSFAGWLSKDMHIAIIVKISQAPTQLALLLLPVSREQFKVCANRFEWHPATVLFVYSVLLSLPGQPPCLHSGFCRDSVAVSAADLLLRGF